MVAVANRGLRHLSDEGLGITQQQMQHGTGTIEFPSQKLRIESKTLTCTLNDCTAGSGFTSHELGYPHDALIAYEGNFRGRAIFHDIEQRDDGGGREVHMAQDGARLVHHLGKWHLYGF